MSNQDVMEFLKYWNGGEDEDEEDSIRRRAEDAFKDWWWAYFLSWPYQMPVAANDRVAALFAEHWEVLDKASLFVTVLEELEEDGFISAEERLGLLNGEIGAEELKARIYGRSGG